jgi:hypothetical protein
VDRGGGPEDTVFVAGHDRSGTTWIAEILGTDHRYRYIFEPFSPGRLDITGPFRPRQYLRPGVDDPRYLDPARAIISGRVRSVWTDKYNRAVLPRKRLIKDVRANLLLPWLQRQFPAMPLVYLLRHPCAVAHSQMKVSDQWKADVGRFLRQEALVEDHLQALVPLLEAVETPFERHVAVWCIDNYVPLRTLPADRVHLAFYEDFCMEPEREVRRLLDHLGEPFTQEALRAVTRPSATTRRDSAIVSGESLVEGWRRNVTPDEMGGALRILEAFGLDRIYGRDPMPLARDALRS